jgi:phosphomannomutase
MFLLEAVCEAGAPLSEVVAPYDRYPASGEINFKVSDQARVSAAVSAAFAQADHDDLDGLTVRLADGWFNLRPSNTEPLLRLNVEGDDMAAMERIRDEVAASVRASDGDS